MQRNAMLFRWLVKPGVPLIRAIFLAILLSVACVQTAWEAVEAVMERGYDEERAIDYIMSNYRHSARDSLAAVIRANNRVRRTKAEK